MSHERLFNPDKDAPLEPSVVTPEEYRLAHPDWEPEVKPHTGESLEIVVDWDRAEEVLGALLEQYEYGGFPFDQEWVRLPHDPRHMPESLPRGGVEHAMFMWNICYYMRGGIKSVDAVKRMSTVYEDYPELFNCRVAAEWSEDSLVQILKSHGLGFQETASEHWIENARRMQERWSGDPRKIFSGVESYEDAVDRIKNDGKGGGFKGFKEKMTSMITYYLADEGLIEPFLFPIPVDIHVMRISIANELIRFPDALYGTDLGGEETLATLRKLYYDYALKHEINPLRLCDAVWLSSSSLCGKHPGNVTLEPLGRKNRAGRNTILNPLPVNPDDPKQRADFEKTCARCPIREKCVYNVPGKHYFVGGAVIIRGKRVVFPESAQMDLFDQLQNE